MRGRALEFQENRALAPVHQALAAIVFENPKASRRAAWAPVLSRRKVMKNMEITDIRIKKVASEGKMKAVASVTFDNAFAVHDVKVIEGPEKLFVAMPSRRTPDGEYRDIAHPINSDMRNMLESKVLAAYDAIEDEPAPETAE